MRDPHPHIEDPFVYEDHLDIIDEISAERSRQVEDEGWSPEHDDEYTDGQLALAAACYAAHQVMPVRSVPMGPHQIVSVPKFWPWSWNWWKPRGKRRDLIRAAALIVAEIERIDRLEKEKPHV